MKKILPVFLVALGALALISFVFFARNQAHQSLGEVFSLNVKCTDSDNCVPTDQRNWIYLLSGSPATTTLSMDSHLATSIDLNLQLVGSTTAAGVLWNVEFSNDNVTWFGEDTKSLTTLTTTVHGAATTTHAWFPGNYATSSRNITIAPSASRYVRVSFGPAGANAGLWAQAVMKSPSN